MLHVFHAKMPIQVRKLHRQAEKPVLLLVTWELKFSSAPQSCWRLLHGVIAFPPLEPC